MNKQTLIKRVADKTGLTQKDCGAVLEGMLSSVTEALAAGEAVKITGFGSFEVKRRAARVGRNPKTGERVAIPAQAAPVFRPGRGLKGIVDGRGGK